MTKNIIEYLIRAGTPEEAEGLASLFSVPDDSWTYIPLVTGEETVGVYKQATSVVLTHDEWELASEAERHAATLSDNWGCRILLASSFWSAAKYAADQNWWLHAWSAVEIPTVDKVIEYQKIS